METLSSKLRLTCNGLKKRGKQIQRIIMERQGGSSIAPEERAIENGWTTLLLQARRRRTLISNCISQSITWNSQW
jgi:hypothetical protein